MALGNQPILILGPQENSKPGRWSRGQALSKVLAGASRLPPSAHRTLGRPSIPDRGLPRT